MGPSVLRMTELLHYIKFIRGKSVISKVRHKKAVTKDEMKKSYMTDLRTDEVDEGSIYQLVKQMC